MSKLKTEPKTEHIETLTEFCKICGRVAWGEIVRLGFLKWRHESCGIGSEEWLAYYHALPENERTALLPLFVLHYPTKDFFVESNTDKGVTQNEVPKETA